jgi:predicted Zn finger-like uncharacterized protein
LNVASDATENEINEIYLEETSMIITCPECSTKFSIDDDKLPDGIAKLRCARCKHVFQVEKEAASDDAVINEFSYEKFQELDTAEKEESFNLGDNRDELNMDVNATKETPEKIQEANSTLEEPSNVTQKPQKKSGILSGVIKALLLIILLLLIAVGVYIYQNGTEALNQRVQTLLGQQVDSPTSSSSGEIALSNPEGMFINNAQAGELFLIRGVAINNFSTPRAGIQVKGVIFDQNGKPLLQKTVFCGNPIDDNALKTLEFSALEELMGNQFGKDLSNMKVGVKQEIPFDIVFKDLPANLSEFSVKVTASKPADE